MKGQTIVIHAKIEYVLTNSAGQEAFANSMMVYEINKMNRVSISLFA